MTGPPRTRHFLLGYKPQPDVGSGGGDRIGVPFAGGPWLFGGQVMAQVGWINWLVWATRVVCLEYTLFGGFGGP